MYDWSDCGEVNATPETSYTFSRQHGRYLIFKDSCNEIREISPKVFKANVVYRIDFVIWRQNVRVVL